MLMLLEACFPDARNELRNFPKRKKEKGQASAPAPVMTQSKQSRSLWLILFLVGVDPHFEGFLCVLLELHLDPASDDHLVDGDRKACLQVERGVGQRDLVIKLIVGPGDGDFLVTL